MKLAALACLLATAACGGGECDIEALVQEALEGSDGPAVDCSIARASLDDFATQKAEASECVRARHDAREPFVAIWTPPIIDYGGSTYGLVGARRGDRYTITVFERYNGRRGGEGRSMTIYTCERLVATSCERDLLCHSCSGLEVHDEYDCD